MNLNIRTKKKTGVAPLQTKVFVEGEALWVNLMMDVDICEWEKVSKGKTTIKRDNYLERLGYTRKLQDIDASFRELRKYNKFTKESVRTAVQNVVLADARERVKKAKKLAKELEDKKQNNIRNYVVGLVGKVVSGEARTSNGDTYKKNSIKIWKQFQRVFLDFYDKYPFDWDDINKGLVDRYSNYLEKDCGFLRSTSGRHIGLFRTIVRLAETSGVHTNYTAKNAFHIPPLKEEDKTKEIYLTKEELDALYNMKLTGFEEEVRDVFLIGCYTAQRFSDYGKIDETCIGKTAKGTKVIRLIQKKTKQAVVIPIMDNRLEVLLKKYNYNVPDLIDVCVNRAIKRICKRLSKDVPSLAMKERTRLDKKEREQERKAKEKGEELFEYDDKGYVLKPRYSLIKTHTARRTGITLMYLSGNYTMGQMMSVSGHKKESTFREYIKLSADEFADDVASASSDGLF